MKAVFLSLALTISLFIVLVVGMLRPTIWQFVLISGVIFIFQILVTAATVHWWRPQGLSSRQSLVVILSCLVVVLFLMSLVIAGRQARSWPLTLATDSTIQTEVALRLLEAGHNPYAENYYGTELEQYDYPKSLASINPALENFVYLPTTLWVSYPLYKITDWSWSFFDQRFVLAVAFLFLFFLLYWPLRSQGQAAVWLAPLIIVNPWFSYNLLAGQNDILPLLLVVGAMICWQNKKFTLGTVILALAVTTKQTVWFILPFALLYLWQAYDGLYGPERTKRLCHQLCWFFGIALLSLMPFLWWDVGALWQDTVGYIIGSTSLTYPVWGVGLGEALFRLGIIDSRQGDFPFWLVQILVTVPLFSFLLLKQSRRQFDIVYVMGAWAVGLGGSWLVGRFFAPAHLGFIITVLSVAYLIKLRLSQTDQKVYAK